MSPRLRTFLSRSLGVLTRFAAPLISLRAFARAPHANAAEGKTVADLIGEYHRDHSWGDMEGTYQPRGYHDSYSRLARALKYLGYVAHDRGVYKGDCGWVVSRGAGYYHDEIWIDPGDTRTYPDARDVLVPPYLL